MNDRLLVD